MILNSKIYNSNLKVKFQNLDFKFQYLIIKFKVYNKYLYIKLNIKENKFQKS